MYNKKINELYPNIYHISDYKVNVTLIKGKKCSILWDMGYGINNLNKTIKQITNTPLIVIASHGHRDHVLGCTDFKEIYLSKKDNKLFIQSNNKKTRKLVSNNFVKKHLMTEEEALEYINKQLPTVKEIKPNDKFDLGDLHIEVVSLHGHTKGSIGLLIKEYNLLLTGDAICNDLWLYLKESERVSNCIEMLEEVIKLPFDSYIAAHKTTIYPKKQILNIIEVLKNLDSSKSRLRSTHLTNEEIYENHKYTKYGNISILFTEENL